MLSVLLPYRDVEGTLGEALESVLSEREVPLELLAVDDGSADGGPALVRAWASRDPRVVPVEAGGRGLVAALEVGRARARFPWIARMDGDDVSLPGRFAAQLALAAQTPRVGAVGTRVEGFPEGAVGEGLARYIDWMNELVSPEEHARDLFIEAPLCHPSVLLPRAALDAVGGWKDPRWAEDYDLWVRLHLAGYALCKVPRVLLRWRHREGRATFTHERYGVERFRELKAHYLAPRLRAEKRRVLVWGAGPFGKRLARALEGEGVRAQGFIDIDPRKREARGVRVHAPEALALGEDFVLVCVGAQGARQLIRAHLLPRGWREGEDFLCVS